MEKGIFVCDIGGTNCRVSIFSFTKKASEKFSKIYKTESIKDLSDLLNKISKQTKISCRAAIIAAAGPIVNDSINLVNAKLKIRKKDLKEKSNFDDVIILNDFGATAYSLKYFKGNDLIKHGPGTDTGNVLVIGAGTGLGIMHLTNLHNGKFRINSSEDAHSRVSSYFPIDKSLMKFAIGKKKRDLTFEDLCSGKGLETTYKFLTKKALNASQISNKAQNGNKDAVQAMKLFFNNYAKIIDHFATRFRCDTIYIFGGIAMKNLNFADEGFFEEIGPRRHVRIVKNDKTRRSIAKYYFENRSLGNTLNI